MNRRIVHQRKPFTPEEEYRISQYKIEGYTCLEIAELMDRSLASIKGKMQRMHTYGNITDRKEKRDRKKSLPRRLPVDMISPMSGITEFWEDALRLCNVEIKTFNGQRALFIGSKPVSIFTILSMANKSKIFKDKRHIS